MTVYCDLRVINGRDLPGFAVFAVKNLYCQDQKFGVASVQTALLLSCLQFFVLLDVLASILF